MTDQASCELPAFRASDETVRRILERYRTVAVVGLSKDPAKPSHVVPKYLQEHGDRVPPPVCPAVRRGVTSRWLHGLPVPHPSL